MTDYKVHKVFLKDCDDGLYAQFYKLNKGSAGVMQGIMPGLKNKSGSLGFYIIEEERVLGWAFVFKRNDYYGTHSRIRACHIWVDPEQRGKKIGFTIIKVLTSQCKTSKLRPYFYPHDNRSHSFYNYLVSKKIIDKDMLKSWWS
jgi:hypothetical protein